MPRLLVQSRSRDFVTVAALLAGLAPLTRPEASLVLPFFLAAVVMLFVPYRAYRTLRAVAIASAYWNRSAEERIFPLARDRGIGVLVYLPFGRTRMWSRIGDRALPDWAAEFDAETWAQFMLKFVVAQPAVTVAAPGTGDPEHMVDNIGGGRGRLPTPEHLQRMIELERSLPGA